MPDTPAAPVTEIGHVIDGPAWWQALEDEPTIELRWPMSVQVYDRMRRQDSQVRSVLRAVTLPVRRTTWRLDPNGADDRVARLVAEDLGLPLVGSELMPPKRMRDRFSWVDHLRLALLMLPLGHSYFEQVYRIVDNQVRLRKLEERPARTIQHVNVASDGGLISIEQWGTTDRADGRPVVIPVDRLVAYVHEREGGNWLGQSLLRPCYKNWLLKDRLLRVQAQTVERNGMGVPTYTGAEDEKDLDKGLKIAKSYRSGDAAGAAIPNGALLKLLGVEGDLPDADKPIRYHDEQIARAVLAHFLNLGTETGSWALGSTFADFFTLSLQSVAQEVADVATQHIVEDLVDLNWGEDEPAPRIVFDEIGSRHPATAEAIKWLVDSGALQPDDDVEEYLRNAYGLPGRTSPRLEPPAAPAPPVEEPPALPPVRPAAARTVRAAAKDSVDTTYASRRSLHRSTAEAALKDLFERQREAVEADGELAETWDEDLADVLFTASQSVARDIATRAARDMGGTVKAQTVDLSTMDAWLLTVAENSAARINEATREKIAEAQDSDDEDPVGSVFDVLVATSAAMYARSLVTQAASFAAEESAEVVGYGRKTWKVNSSDPRSTHAAMNGESVALDAEFSNGMRRPGDSTDPHEVANCECSLIYEVG